MTALTVAMMDSAFDAGFRAFYAGRPVSDNPHNSGALRVAWFEAWHLAKRELATRNA